MHNMHPTRSYVCTLEYPYIMMRWHAYDTSPCLLDIHNTSWYAYSSTSFLRRVCIFFTTSQIAPPILADRGLLTNEKKGKNQINIIVYRVHEPVFEYEY